MSFGIIQTIRDFRGVYFCGNTPHMQKLPFHTAALPHLSAQYTTPFKDPSNNLLQSQTTRDCRHIFPYYVTSQPTGSHSPDHCYKLCWLTNCTAGRPAWPSDKSRPTQASDSIPLLTKRSKHSQLAKGVTMFDRTSTLRARYLME
jgi:hypothetical protein